MTPSSKAPLIAVIVPSVLVSCFSPSESKALSVMEYEGIARRRKTPFGRTTASSAKRGRTRAAIMRLRKAFFMVPPL